MGKPNDTRRHRRFSVRYPVEVRFSPGDTRSGLQAVSNNVSVGGVLLEADSPLPQHCDVSFTMTVPKHRVVGPIQIVGEGQVVRVERHQSGSGFAIAVQCTRPISKLEDYLPASAS
jgi:PilZ domain